MLKACGAESCIKASSAMSANDDVPVAVGVPESTPAELSVKPGGGAPVLILQINGVSVELAVKVKE